MCVCVRTHVYVEQERNESNEKEEEDNEEKADKVSDEKHLQACLFNAVGMEFLPCLNCLDNDSNDRPLQVCGTTLHRLSECI